MWSYPLGIYFVKIISDEQGKIYKSYNAIYIEDQKILICAYSLEDTNHFKFLIWKLPSGEKLIDEPSYYGKFDFQKWNFFLNEDNSYIVLINFFDQKDLKYLKISDLSNKVYNIISTIDNVGSDYYDINFSTTTVLILESKNNIIVFNYETKQTICNI